MLRFTLFICWLLTLAAALPGRQAWADGVAYDPLSIAAPATDEALDLTVKDETRRREIPLRIYLPTDPKPAAVVLFSHGLGGARTGNPYLGKHWAGRGYAVVFVQHHGSDADVWRNAPLGQRLCVLKQAASLENLLLRLQDVPAVLDQLEAWNKAADHPLAGRLDLSRVGMSGHSFGAITTQGVSGQNAASGLASFTEPRIKAAVIMSPSMPRHGDPSETLGKVAIPWLLMTGTRDNSPIGDMDPASRLKVFPFLPPGGKYELVLFDAQHSAFGDRSLPGDTRGRNPNHHRAIVALSTAFWDTYLNGNEAAKTWLDGDGPRSVLETKDAWQRK